MELHLVARARSTFFSVSLLGCSIYYFFKTVFLNPFLVFNVSKLRDTHFKRFIEVIGPQINENEEHVHAIKTQLLPYMHGTVLDIGPGTGDPLRMFTAFVDNVDVVYGIEPNSSLHPQLLAAASQAGFNADVSASVGSSSSKSSKAARYIPLQAGIEPTSLLPALASAGLVSSSSSSSSATAAGNAKENEMKMIPPEGVFDSIVSIRALCSSPLAQEHPETLITLLHKLLRPGGQLLLFEHVANDADTVAGLTQIVLNTVWPTLAGGCSLRGRLAREMLRRRRPSNASGSGSGSGKEEWKSVDVVPASAATAAARAMAMTPEAKVAIIPFVTIRAVKA